MDTISNKTLEYYNNNAELFTGDTFSADMNRMCELFMKYVPSGSILDLGCGSGRDSKYFLQHGYDVTAIDGSEELCRIASVNTGLDVRCLLFENLDYINQFDGVWACASLLHVKYACLPGMFKKVCRSLKKDGFFYASFKYGEYEGDRGGRFYTDLNENSLERILALVPELSLIESVKTTDVRSGHEEENWLNIIMQII